jgi:hypothetical protein
VDKENLYIKGVEGAQDFDKAKKIPIFVQPK